MTGKKIKSIELCNYTILRQSIRLPIDNSIKEKIFLDGSLSGKDKIVNKLKDIIEPLEVPRRDNE